jgi:hypothetical protein
LITDTNAVSEDNFQPIAAAFGATPRYSKAYEGCKGIFSKKMGHDKSL